tara:strand:- start:1389 stop:1535 length:147 start_codon:yes stop_codon:yes gene_type:complete
MKSIKNFENKKITSSMKSIKGGGPVYWFFYGLGKINGRETWGEINGKF